MITQQDEMRPSAPATGLTRTLLPGLAVVIAGAVHGDGAILSSVYRNQSTVSDEQLSFPWTGSTAITTSLVWGAAQVLITVGLVAFARSGAVAGRPGDVGVRMAVAGSALYVLAHAVSILGYDADLDDPVAVLVLALFGVGTLVTAVGLVLAGRDVRRTGAWTGWRRQTPLVLGLWMLVMLPLQFTTALPLAVGVYAAATVAFGVALLEERLLGAQPWLVSPQ